MNISRGFAPLLILVLIALGIVLLGTGYFAGQGNQQVTTPTDQVSSAQIPTGDFAHNLAHFFSATNNSQGYLQLQRYEISSLATGKTKYVDGSISVYVASDKESVSTCMTPPEGHESSIEHQTMTTLGGEKALYFEESDAATGQSSIRYNYHILHNNLCYFVVGEVSGESVGHLSGTPDYDPAVREWDEVKAAVTNALKTFSF